MWTESMRDFMRNDVSKEQIEAKIFLRRRRQNDPRDGYKRCVELRLLDVLEHDALCTFLLDDFVVIGQIVSGGLDSVISIAGAKDLIYDTDRRKSSQLCVTVSWIFRKVVLEIL